jgi:hypothetical protein
LGETGYREEVSLVESAIRRRFGGGREKSGKWSHPGRLGKVKES